MQLNGSTIINKINIAITTAEFAKELSLVLMLEELLN